MKLREREELERMEKLAAEIERNPLTKKFREDEAAETLIRRKAASEAIVTLQKEQAVNLPKLQADLKVKEKKYLMAKATLETVLNELRTAQAVMFRENIDFNSAIKNHEQVLLDTYDPKIDEAITYFMDRLDFLRKPGRITRTGRKSERNLISWTKKTHGESNRNAVLNTMRYCQVAIHEILEMRLQPELDLQKIQAWKDNLPKIDIYQEYTGHAPMERQAPTIVKPCEFTFKKLLEKVNKHLVTPTKKARI